MRRFWPAALILASACAPADTTHRDSNDVDHSSTAARTGDKEQVMTATPSAADDRFATVAKTFLESYLERQPVRATEAGDHRFDDRWPDLSEEGDNALRSFIASTRKDVAAAESAALSLQSRVDAAMLKNQLDLMEMAVDELKPTENDPLVYMAVLGDGLDPLVTREFGTPESRAKALRLRLEGVPGIVAIAKRRLKRPPRIHTQTAIDQNKGLVDLCTSGFDSIVKAVPAEKEGIERAAKKAKDALTELQTFLEKELLPRSDGDFRLGAKRFEKKLRLILDDEVDAEAQKAEALAYLHATQLEMVDTAKELWPELMKTPWKEPATDADRKAVVKTILTKLAEDRSTDATVVKDIETTLASATDFVRQHDLVRLPEEPCSIIEMPEYRRGVAVAYCDASGPLEPKPETFYAISPTPKGWPKKRVESYYREYNRSMLHDLTVHEAMPGHFLQLMHNNRFPSKLRAVFSHGAFVEGWAVYGEWLMAKHGYGGPKVRMQRQKMALRMAANAVLDHGVHAAGMTEKQAMDLMMGEAFQEEGEAVGKWRRACLTSAQLTTYYYGFSQMMKLRKTYESRPGFKERSYHDRLLSFGSPSPRHVASLMEATASQ
ncbi:MAG: DUF885 domain-containing protein [Polyangiaceae bacterium]|nr:DUF885 domain-containing protein [Polyangiaceae bacterium]